MSLSCEMLPLAAVPWLSGPTRLYLQTPEHLRPLYQWPPTPAAAREALQKMDEAAYDRRQLAEVIRTQYQQRHPQLLSAYPALSEALDALADPRSVVVVGGQQIHLWGGPLYVAAKIATIIATARFLRHHLRRPVIPVFWMHTEDHDYEEIRCVRYAGQSFCSPYQPPHPFPVGNLPAEAGQQLEAVLPPTLQASFPYFSIFREAYRRSRDLADATRYWLGHLWGPEGLVAIDPATPALKSMATSLFEKELNRQLIFTTVTATRQAHGQWWQRRFVPPRPVNLFYLHPRKGRIRIERIGDQLRIDGEVTTPEALLRHPHRLSPNVLLRPLYQQRILPAIATILGPAEIGYWLQLKAAFDHAGVFLPQLLPRDWFAYLPEACWQWWQKQRLPLDILFQPADQAEARWLDRQMPRIIRWQKEMMALMEKYDAAFLHHFRSHPADYWKWKKQRLKEVRKIVRKTRKNLRETHFSDLQRLHRLITTLGRKQTFQDRRLFLPALGTDWPADALRQMPTHSKPYHPAVIICPY